MNHHTLREIAKIGVGVVIADIISTLWLSAGGFLPLTVLGVQWTAAMIPEIIVFDVALILLLVHVGWKVRLPVTSPSERTLLFISGAIFLVVALAHLTRLTAGARIILGDFEVPLWLSWIGVFIAAYLSYASFHFALLRRR